MGLRISYRRTFVVVLRRLAIALRKSIPVSAHPSILRRALRDSGCCCCSRLCLLLHAGRHVELLGRLGSVCRLNCESNVADPSDDELYRCRQCHV